MASRPESGEGGGDFHLTGGAHRPAAAPFLAPTLQPRLEETGSDDRRIGTWKMTHYPRLSGLMMQTILTTWVFLTWRNSIVITSKKYKYGNLRAADVKVLYTAHTHTTGGRSMARPQR